MLTERLQWIIHLVAEEEFAPDWNEWNDRWNRKDGGPSRQETAMLCRELIDYRAAEEFRESVERSDQANEQRR